MVMSLIVLLAAANLHDEIGGEGSYSDVSVFGLALEQPFLNLALNPFCGVGAGVGASLFGY